MRWLEHPRAPLAVVAFALLLALPLTALERVGQRAKQRTGERLTNLLCHIQEALLRDAYHRLRKQAAPGADEVTIAQLRDCPPTLVARATGALAQSAMGLC